MRLTYYVVSASLGFGGYGVGVMNTRPLVNEKEIAILQDAIKAEKAKVYSLADKIEDIRNNMRYVYEW